MRMNFSRVHWDTIVTEGKYIKLEKPEYNWVWSPQHAVNMHMPERFGYVQFTTRSADITRHSKDADMLIDIDNEIIAREILMRIFYAQQVGPQSHTPPMACHLYFYSFFAHSLSIVRIIRLMRPLLCSCRSTIRDL